MKRANGMHAARATFLFAVIALVAGCTRRGDTVVVGGKNFTEQRVLTELVAQAIEREGIAADRRPDLGGTFVCDTALRAGEIDVYVEYTGTALGAVLKRPATGTSAAQVLDLVRDEYAKAGLVWTAPLGFDNTFALVVRGDAGVSTISAAVPVAKKWNAAFGYEFRERADGFPALERTYGLEFASVTTMDLGLLYRALESRQADVVVGSATDAAIARLSLRVLADDKGAFPPYEAVPVVRRDALERHPGLGRALESLAGSLDAVRMRALNEEVEGKKRAPAEVVREALAGLPAR